MKTIDQCIEGFIEEVTNRKNVDFMSKASIKRFNAAYDKCVKHLLYIDTHYPEQIEKIMQLLQHPDVEVISHCAPIVLKLNNATRQQKEHAIEIVRKLTTDTRLDPVRQFGFKASLEKWEKVYLTQDVAQATNANDSSTGDGSMCQ